MRARGRRTRWRSGAARIFPLRHLLSISVLLSWSGYASGEDWPQFRGPNCTGVSRSEKALPVEFSDNENVRWSATIGDGVSSPVVAAGRVFTTAMVEEGSVALFCFDAETGEKLWQRDWPTGPLPPIHKVNSHASGTPAADAERVYFYFSTLGLQALDAETGELVWKTGLPVPYFVFGWGAGMSPVLFEDKVLFCQDDDLHPALYAIDTETGRILWKDNRYDMAVNYSHPIVCDTRNGPEIVVAGTGKMIGYDPHDGRRLWHARVLLRNIKTTPVSRDGILYVSLESGGIANQWLGFADKNKDRKLTRDEIREAVKPQDVPDAFFKNKFDRGDVDGDGVLQGEELDNAFLHPGNIAGGRWDAENPSDSYVLAVRGGGRGEVTSTHLLWKHRSQAPDHVVSPLVVENRMFVVKGGGISSCFDTGNGELLWARQRIGNTANYFASPVYGDGKIYVTGANGIIVVLESGPEVKILAKNDMGESCVATPAIADGKLFIRTRKKLYCVANPSD